MKIIFGLIALLLLLFGGSCAIYGGYRGDMRFIIAAFVSALASSYFIELAKQLP